MYVHCWLKLQLVLMQVFQQLLLEAANKQFQLKHTMAAGAN
jgi:hypothetical protein